MGLFGETSIIFQPSFTGVAIQIIIIALLWIWMYAAPNNGFILLFKGMIESMHNFLEEILGRHEKKRIISLLTSIFFVVIIANFLWLTGDIFGEAFVSSEGETWLGKVFQSFSSDKNATTALAFLVVLLSLLVQIAHLGPIKFFHEYVPVLGKGFLSVERWDKSALAYYPMMIVVKIFDIIISLFIGILDIIGVLAKVISLSFRLFGNMFSGTILLGLLTQATISLSQAIGSVDMPFVIPTILWLQGILVALVQAFVVTLLAAIFIKVAKT